MVVSQAALIYIPIYEQYRAGCVTNTANGTFITENLYSIAYNYAAAEGDAKTYAVQNAHDADRYVFCIHGDDWVSVLLSCMHWY